MASAAAGADGATDSSSCPMSAQILAAHQQLKQGTGQAVCPLGFGSSRGPKLSSLHCPVCRGLLFDAHTTVACKHTFCHACISNTNDCPVCGRDVEGIEPNTEVAGVSADLLHLLLALFALRAALFSAGCTCRKSACFAWARATWCRQMPAVGHSWTCSNLYGGPIYWQQHAAVCFSRFWEPGVCFVAGAFPLASIHPFVACLSHA